MHTLLTFSGRRGVDALLLSASPDRLRVVIPGRGDTVELRMVEGCWTSDRGVPVEIGALMVDDRLGPAHFLPQGSLSQGSLLQNQVRTSSAV